MPFFPQFSNLFVAPYIPTSPLLSGLLAYWKLNTTAWLDSSGNGNTLDVTNGSSSNITIESGRVTTSARFSANGTFLEKSDFEFPSSWTISFWGYKINTDSNLYFPSFWDFGYNNGTRVVQLAGGEDDNNQWIYTDNPYPINYGQSFPANENQWYHYCVTQDSSGLNWYIDNSLYATDNGDASARAGTGLAIGAQGAGGDFYASQGNYRICEYGVWNRALTGAEITSLYNAGAGKTYPFN